MCEDHFDEGNIIFIILLKIIDHWMNLKLDEGSPYFNTFSTANNK